MRLGQLARKLALRPSEIVEFLAENNVQIAEGTNVRMEKDQITLVMKKFVPGWVEAPETEDVEAQEEIRRVEPVAEVHVPNEETETIAESDTEQPLPPDGDEVIRAPKIELSGLKVVGKIYLPEPKKKEEPAQQETTPVEDEKKIDRPETRRATDANRRRHQRSEKNPIALQREKEAKEAQKKRLEEQAREKEKRTQNYLKNYKPSSPTKAAKIFKEEVIEMTPQELEEPPKTLLGKIIRWLTKAS